MQAHECNKSEVIDFIREDIKEIKKDIKTLLRAKAYIMGGAAVVGSILAFVINFIASLTGR